MRRDCSIMFLISIFYPVFLATGSLTLTIDTQLGTSVEDCFERVLIGGQLPESGIYRNVTELTSRECDQVCKRDTQCRAYDYGVGAKGNATCNLSNLSEKELKDNQLLKRHPDYDVYIRRFQCEQSPPKPIQTVLDDPVEGPVHKPVFRPIDDDSKIPLEDEAQNHNDLRPYETSYRPNVNYYRPFDDRPYRRPYHDKPNYADSNYLDHDRPDDIYAQNPEVNQPLGYGAHQVVNVPYVEEKPSRPSYNFSYNRPKPDPNDVFYFHHQHHRPTRPFQHYESHLKPDLYPVTNFNEDQDIYGPSKPYRLPASYKPVTYKPDKYWDTPIKKPLYGDPIENQGNNTYKPTRPSPERPDPQYGETNIEQPYKPEKPQNPERPVYGSQNNYPTKPETTSQNYNEYNEQKPQYGADNHIYLEISDPQRPNRPTKRPTQNNHGGHIDDVYGQYHGWNQNLKPDKPSYVQGQNSYGVVEKYPKPYDYDKDPQNSYGSQYGQKPLYKPTIKPFPSYGNNHGSYGYKPEINYDQNPANNYDFQSNYQSNRPYQGYGSQNSYGSVYNYNNHNNYDIYQDNYHNNYGSYGGTQHKPIRPQYGYEEQNYNKPSPGYGGVIPSYEGGSLSYGDHNYQRPTKPGYGNDYATNRPSQGIKPGYSDVSYGDNSYQRPTKKPVYGNHYESNMPSQGYGYVKPGYGDVNQEYGYQDYQKPTKKPQYGVNYETNKPSQGYGSVKPDYGNANHGYDNHKPTKPGYDDDDENGYNNDYKNNNAKPKPTYSRPVLVNVTKRPNIRPVYEHESDRPDSVPSYIVRPNGDVVTSRPVSVSDYFIGKPVSYRACFRRVLAGKRAVRSHVRKVIPCDTLEDCRKECAVQKRFHCESFNYKIDPSFRGKGLCELMTKPIEAFDIARDFVEDKDYDFYEIDRNSLEPYCPETLKGPGLLHSGYLSSKPSSSETGHQKRWDRFEYGQRWGSEYDRRGSYGGDRNYGRRRFEEPYIPYQIGIGRSNDDETWGEYGGTYGGHNIYYKNPKDYTNSKNYWRLETEYKGHDHAHGHPHGHIPHEFDHHALGSPKYGEEVWKSYGYGYGHKKWDESGHGWNSLDYGESSYYKPEKPHYDNHGHTDCSPQRRPGMSLGSGAIRRSLFAANVVECEAACFGEREFKCVSYSYRYSNAHGSDNCFLSERPYKGAELSSDSGSDVYSMPEHSCHSVATKFESECFYHVRSGAAISSTAAVASLTVTGLGACEAECIRLSVYCKGFSFRFNPPVIGEDVANCILTTSLPTTLTVGNGLRPSHTHEVYARGIFVQACEPPDHPQTNKCYLQYESSARLLAAAVRAQAHVPGEAACEAACTHAPFTCLSFSYNNAAPAGVENCLLSQIRIFDLQRGVDYEHSVDDWLFAFDLFNPKCVDSLHALPSPSQPAGPSGGSAPSGPPYLPERPTGPYLPDKPTGPSYPPSSPEYHPAETPNPGFKPIPPPPTATEYEPPFERPAHFAPSGPNYPTGPSGPGYRPTGPDHRPDGPSYRPDGPGYRPDGPGYRPDGPAYRPSEPDHRPNGPGYGSRPPVHEKPGYLPTDKEDGPMSIPWRHYTVSGYPCRSGTTCAQNHVAGHWACEPEGGEIGSWDYCCAPNHQCGYSEGFHKPWCYVGPHTDQWRPCSDKYYPYHQHNVPHPSQDHRKPVPWDNRPDGNSYLPINDHRPPAHSSSIRHPPEGDPKYWDDLYQNGPKAYYDQYGNPLPGYIRVPTSDRPRIRPNPNQWHPLASHGDEGLDPPVPGGLGVARYWPVAYLHKGPPPNVTFYQYNETDHITTTTERYQPQPLPKEKSNNFNRTNNERKDKLEGRSNNFNIKNTLQNISKSDNENKTNGEAKLIDALKANVSDVIKDLKDVASNVSKEILGYSEEDGKESDSKEEVAKGISGKIDDFSGSIEVLDIEDAQKGEKQSDLKTLEAEERQIEAIGRLLASRRGGQILEKRSQKDLEADFISFDEDPKFNFGNKFPTERKGVIQKVTKEELRAERDRNDRSLEVSETTYVRPPRVLTTTTDNIRKAVVNGKVFYDATIKDLNQNNTRKPYSRQLDDKGPSVLTNQSSKKKNIRARNVNPVRRVRRLYRKRYNPDEVRRRLLEREKSKQESEKTLP